MLRSIKFERFTAFEKLEVQFSPGINVFIGENGTGKTHILKAAYAACDIVKTGENYADKIVSTFYPYQKQIGRLVKRTGASAKGSIEVVRNIEEKKTRTLQLTLSNHAIDSKDASVVVKGKNWSDTPVDTAYIPVKDMMANAPGFRSLYDEREIHFESVYVDILRKAFLPIKKGPTDTSRKQLLETLQEAMDGKVVAKNEEFFLKNKQGELEFTLLAEGHRKLGLLWILIQNGTLLNGSTLFWDEPETNLNPKLLKAIAGILLDLQRFGVQIFIATHDYVLLKEFDLQGKVDDKVLYHSLFRNKDTKEIEVASTDNYLNISPNTIDDTFGSLIDREIQKSMGAVK